MQIQQPLKNTSMERLHSNKNHAKPFLILGLFLLLSTLLFGLMGAIEYAFPGIWRDIFSFVKIRPLHVSSAVFWILIAAVGAVIFYLREHRKTELQHLDLLKATFYLLGGSFIAILISYFFGVFGGREYWEFNQWFALPILFGWIVFIVFFLRNLNGLRNQPVYVWMWFTGVLFFLFTYLESNLWILPEIRNNLVKDMTIQWKSYGSLVGAWNMLIYGSSIYLLDKIAGNTKYNQSPLAFWIYFLGLFNLMFNWGHHIYTLPTQPYVHYIAYGVSMTELLLFGRIIYLWQASIDTAKKNFHIESYRFLIAADVWVFLTLGLAIAMSIPALNIYMHGTHVVVGHTMGATIGINTMLLLAYISDIFHSKGKDVGTVRKGYWIFNISLLVFWLVLIIAGFIKSYWQFNDPDYVYAEMMASLKPYFHIFLLSGCTLIIGLTMIVAPLLKRGWANKG